MGKHGRVQIHLTPEAARVAARFPSISQAVNTALVYWGEQHPEKKDKTMRIRYYVKDEAGIVTGPRIADGYRSVHEFLADHYRDDETPERAELIGWPDRAVTWYGDIGVVS